MKKTLFSLIVLSLTVFLFSSQAYSQTECSSGSDDITGNAGDLVNYTVPADANSVTLTVKGADGGDTPVATGGEGATITATFPVCPECTVKPGSTITFALGGAGESSDNLGGAGGGGASVVFVDGVSYPLIIAGGGGGASESAGEGGQDEFNAVATLAGSGGTQNFSGAGGGGGGAIDTDGTTSDGGDGFAAPGAGVGGVSLAGFISQGGDGGQKSSFGTSFPGRDGGIGGGGAGGDGREGLNPNTGGGGGGGGYIGGDANAGQAPGDGGTSYTYPGNIAGSVTEVEGADGGGTKSNGFGSVCYTSNNAASSCDGSNQLLNSTFGDYGNVDQLGKDIYIDDSSICRESWAFTGAWENSAGNSEGALCDEAQFDADLGSGDSASGTISQTVANICKSQEVQLCFEYEYVFAASAEKEVIVTLGGQEYVRFYTPDPSQIERLYEDGADADDVTVVNESLNINKEPGDNLVGGATYKVCITDYNYDGAIPAEVKLSFTSTNGGGGEEVVNIDNFTLTYSDIGSPVLQDETSLAETPGACEGTFDLTTMAPATVPDGLVLAYKDSGGNVVADPTSVGSGTYSVCYTRDASNPACSPTSTCLDEVCTEVTVVCTTITPVELTEFDAVPDNTDALLSWTTASEQGNSHFEIERSLDGVDYTYVDQVASLGDEDGNSQGELNYGFEHKGAAFVENQFVENVYYRLKQVDNDGVFRYSEVRLVNFTDAVVDMKLFPNPASIDSQVVIQSDEINHLAVYDSNGQLVKQIDGLGAVKSTSISTVGLSRGTYVVVINKSETMKLILQ